MIDITQRTYSFRSFDISKPAKLYVNLYEQILILNIYF